MFKPNFLHLIVGATLATAVGARPGHAVTYSFQNFDAPDARTTLVTGISNTGAVTGYELVASTGGIDGFIRAPDGTFTLFAVPGASGTAPFGINASGQVVGYYQYGPNNVAGAFLRAADGTITLLNDPTATSTYALGINDAGQVTQAAVDASGKQRYFRRDSDGTTATLNVPGVAIGINNAAEVAGYYFGGTFASGYATGADGMLTTFNDPAAQGSETLAYGINDLGLVSGSYNDPGLQQHFGFVRNVDGSFTTLADPASTGSTFGIGINDAGQVSGYYDIDGSASRGFIATPLPEPVPEPATAALLGVGIAALGGLRTATRRFSRQKA